jgi:hypothetical protein
VLSIIRRAMFRGISRRMFRGRLRGLWEKCRMRVLRAKRKGGWRGGDDGVVGTGCDGKDMGLCGGEVVVNEVTKS